MSMSRIRPKGRLLTAAAVVAALTASLLGAVSAAPVSAAVGDRPAITLNMQGSTQDAESTWTFSVGNLFNRSPASPPVLALQEVGPSWPARAPGSRMRTFSGNDLAALPAGMAAALPVGNGIPAAASQVVHTQWRSGWTTRDVYFLQTDRNNGSWRGGRVNLAIVTARPADEVVVVPNPLGPATGFAARAALGVRFGDTWYFSIHALSGGGNDAPGLLRNIDRFVNSRPNRSPLGEEAFVLGDYNRDPTSLFRAGIPGGGRIYNSGEWTQEDWTRGRRGELDYAVLLAPGGHFPADGMTATALDRVTSDHRPVQFSMPVPTPTFSPVPVFSTSRALENTQAGGVLDGYKDGTANFTPLDAFRRTGRSNQRWNVDTYPDGTLRFRGAGSGRCVDITYSDHDPGPGRNLSLYDCTDQASQRWRPVYVGGGVFLLASVERPALCMNVSGGQSDPNRADSVILWNCENTANERWRFTPADLSTRTTATPQVLSLTAPSPITLENMRTGAVADLDHGRTAVNTAVVSWMRNGQANQSWRPDWHRDQSVSFRSDASDLCIDIHNSDTAAPGRDLVDFTCTGQPSQSWDPEQLDNGQVELRNIARPDLCMDINNATYDPNRGNLAVNSCNGSAGQQWLFVAFGMSLGLPFGLS